MSDANRTIVRAIAETVFNTTPATPRFETQLINNSVLSAGVQTVISDRLDSTRNVADLILVGNESGGGWDFETSYGAQDLLIEVAMMNTWSEKTFADNDGTADSNITDVETVGDTYTTVAVTPVWILGMLVNATGFTDALNNGIKTAVAASGSTTLDVAENLAIDAAPAAAARLKHVGMVGASGDLSSTAGATDSIDITATSGDFTTFGLNVGEWVLIGGTAAGDRFATGANNDWARISSITATTLVFDIVPTGWATDAGAGQTIKVWFGDSISNGVTERSLSIEQEFPDLAVPEFLYYSGMRPDIEWSMPNKSLVTGAVSFMGATFTAPATSRFAGATTKAAPTTGVMNTSSNVGEIQEGGVDLGDPNFVLEATLSFNNTLRRQDAVGSLDSIGIGLGRFMCEGTLNTYYGSSALYTKLLNNTVSGYNTKLIKDNQASVWDVPTLKFKDGNPDSPGVDTDRVIPLGFQGIKDPILGYTALYQRFEHVETS